MSLHNELTGPAAVHQSAYVQPTDPGAVGALKAWIDTSTDPASHKVRNATNDGWITVGTAGSSVAWADITGKPATFPPDAHNHDDRYFTETESDGRYVRTVNGTGPDGSGNVAVAGGGGITPAWMNQGSGALFAPRGDGNPITVADLMRNNMVTGVSPSSVGTTSARAQSFRLPKNLSMTALRVFGTGNLTNAFTFAIYRDSDGVKMWDSGAVSMSSQAWINIVADPPVTLTAGVKYWFAFVGAIASTSTAVLVEQGPWTANLFGADVAPFGGLNIGIPAQISLPLTTASTFPATMPTKTTASVGGTTFGMPIAGITGTAS